MQQCQGRRAVELKQGVGGTAYRSVHPAGPKEAAGQSGLAGAELAPQVQHREVGGLPRSRARELPAKVLGVLRAVAVRVHAPSQVDAVMQLAQQVAGEDTAFTAT